jgi:hypothetical protein
MPVVAAVIDQGALTFDLAVPCEVFGLDRTDIVDPWYEFVLVAAGKRRVRTQTGFVIEAPHGLDELDRADTSQRQGCWTADARRRTGCTWSGCCAAIRACCSTPTSSMSPTATS